MASSVFQNAQEKTVFDGAYEILSVAGRGRKSIVYKASTLDLDAHSSDPNHPQLVALKVFLGNSRDAKDHLLRVSHEASAMLAVRHPNVVQLFDYCSREESPYLVLEYIDGGDILSIIKNQQSPISSELASHLSLQLLSGLNAIHESGIVHRDLKPENVLLASSGHLKITDFGVAVLPTDVLPRGTVQSSVGTLEYLAPECMDGQNASVRSDIYSAAVVCYFIFTGRYPFNGSTIAEVIDQKIAGQHIPLSAYSTTASDLLESVFAKALSVNPDERFCSAREFQNALRQVFLGAPADSNMSVRVVEDLEVNEEEVLEFTEFDVASQGSMQERLQNQFKCNAEVLRVRAGEIFADVREKLLDLSVFLKKEKEEVSIEQVGELRERLQEKLLELRSILQERMSQVRERISDARIKKEFPEETFVEAPNSRKKLLLCAGSAIVLILALSNVMSFSGSKVVEKKVAHVAVPAVPNYQHVGRLQGLFAPGEDVALVMMKNAATDGLLVVLGVSGWVPQMTSETALYDDAVVEFSGSGMRFVLKVQSVDYTNGIVRGTYQEIISLRTGSWEASL